jgi:threonine/homoserine/homoserine lactone efflux protein
MTWTTFAAFLIAVALGAMVPGSTTALVIRQSAVHGARALVGKARKLFAKANFRRRLERATGTVLIGLGVRVALSKL